jgi:pyruvate kinase
LTLADKDAATREFKVEVQNDGIIAKQKGVNIPNTKIPFPALAERDNADIRFGLEQGLNFIAISFVRSAKDVNEVRAILEETGNTHVQLFPKIENQQGIDNIDEIIAASEGIMIARGDMGLKYHLKWYQFTKNKSFKKLMLLVKLLSQQLTCLKQ